MQPFEYASANKKEQVAVLLGDQGAILATNTARLYRLRGFEDGTSPTPFDAVERLVHI